MSEVSDLFNELIQETGWWCRTNDSDCIESPDEEQCAAARRNFDISDKEDVLFIRDTGIRNNFDQGLVITDENIYYIPDNEDISKNFSMRWCDIHTVTYKDNVLYFWDDSEELARIHISYFVVDEDDYDVGDEIAEMLDKIAKSVEDTAEDTAELAKSEINKNLLSESEEEYMNMLRESLEDGTISAGERRLLDRFKLKLGISDARAKELEDSLAKPNLTDDELEYFNEVKESKKDGEISAGERRLLEKLRKMLNITEERAKEIDNMVPVQVTLEAPKTNFKSVYTREDYKKWLDLDENCISAPTVNEMKMYIGAGVYWDDGAAGDNQQTYTLHDGGTYHAGLWVMKKEYISGFREGKAKKRGDTDREKRCFNVGRPATSEIGKYFFLPAAGYYERGCFHGEGSDGFYCSVYDCGLFFSSSSAYVNEYLRPSGYLPMVAE